MMEVVVQHAFGVTMHRADEHLAQVRGSLPSSDLLYALVYSVFHTLSGLLRKGESHDFGRLAAFNKQQVKISRTRGLGLPGPRPSNDADMPRFRRHGTRLLFGEIVGR